MNSDDMRKMVLMKLETVRDGSYYDLLEVDVSSSVEELTAAWERIVEQYEPSRLLAAGIGDLEKEIILIRKVVDEAYEVLAHPSIAEMYRCAQNRGGYEPSRRM
jgi:DnaJ-class molecular chaperone